MLNTQVTLEQIKRQTKEIFDAYNADPYGFIDRNRIYATLNKDFKDEVRANAVTDILVSNLKKLLTFDDKFENFKDLTEHREGLESIKEIGCIKIFSDDETIPLEYDKEIEKLWKKILIDMPGLELTEEEIKAQEEDEKKGKYDDEDSEDSDELIESKLSKTESENNVLEQKKSQG